MYSMRNSKISAQEKWQGKERKVRKEKRRGERDEDWGGGGTADPDKKRPGLSKRAATAQRRPQSPVRRHLRVPQNLGSSLRLSIHGTRPDPSATSWILRGKALEEVSSIGGKHKARQGHLVIQGAMIPHANFWFRNKIDGNQGRARWLVAGSSLHATTRVHIILQCHLDWFPPQLQVITHFPGTLANSGLDTKHRSPVITHTYNKRFRWALVAGTRFALVCQRLIHAPQPCR